jgi:hypothetical protein
VSLNKFDNRQRKHHTLLSENVRSIINASIPTNAYDIHLLKNWFMLYKIKRMASSNACPSAFVALRMTIICYNGMTSMLPTSPTAITPQYTEDVEEVDQSTQHKSCQSSHASNQHSSIHSRTTNDILLLWIFLGFLNDHLEVDVTDSGRSARRGR